MIRIALQVIRARIVKAERLRADTKSLFQPTRLLRHFSVQRPFILNPMKRCIEMQAQAMAKAQDVLEQAHLPRLRRHVAGLARSPVWRPDWALPRSSRTSAWGLVWPM